MIHFNAKVKEVTESGMLLVSHISTAEGFTMNNGDFSVLTDNLLDDVQAGDVVTIWFNGMIKETAPAQLSVVYRIPKVIDRRIIICMKRLKQLFINMKLYKKIMTIFVVVLCVIVPLVITSLDLTFRIYDRKLYEKSSQELEFFIQQINDELKDLEDFSKSIALDEGIQTKLTEMSSEEYLSGIYYYKMDELRRLLAKQIAADDRVKNIIYTDREQVEFTLGTYVGAYQKEYFEKFLEKAEEKRGAYVFQSPTEDYQYIMAGREILEEKNASLNYLGTIALTIDIKEVIEDNFKELETERAELLVCSDETVIYQDEQKGNEIDFLRQVEGDSGYKIIKAKDGTKTFLCYKKSAKTGWIYLNSFPYSEIFGETFAVRTFVLFGFGLSAILVMLFMKKVIKLLVNPLENLTESMKIVEKGDFKEALQLLDYENRKDEIGILVREFQIMMKTIDNLIYENYEKKLLLQETKYQMLQSQINPHFLYNTLNTINWIIRSGENQDASKMIMELGKILRASLSKEEYVPVEKEIAIAESYMVIQQYRYKGRVGLKIEKTGNLEMYYMPKMILQPLIENSIQYGVEKSMDYCEIKIIAEEGEEDISIEVIDNGMGMSEEELETVRTFSMQPKGHGIGLKNISERLKIAYQKSGFQIYSQMGKGTRVLIKIPREESHV